jgi:hypothetical protein
MSGFCEQRQPIDLAQLRRDGMLRPGRTSEIGWSRGGLPTGSLRILALDWGVRLGDELVGFTSTETAFGGQRQWFECPGCRRPCRLLYRGHRVLCRRCHGLRYSSENEGAFGRAIGRAQRLRMRLGGSPSLVEPFPPKPKGMHWKTYRRLEQLDRRLVGGITAAAGRPLGFRTAYKTC